MSIRAAVIGAGRIGSLHAAIYARDPRTELVGIVDANVERARKVGGELGAPVFASTEELLEEAGPDAVSVAVPEAVRREPSLLVARAGCHLLLEKPLASSPAEAESLMEGLRDAPGVVMVNFILRSDPRFLQVREAVQECRLGVVRTITAHRRGTAAGAQAIGEWTNLLISTAIHDIDAMAWIAGAPADRVYAEAVGGASARWGHEDAVVATIRFANGVIGSLDTSWVLPSTIPAPLDAGFKVVGTGGSATIDGASHGLSFVDDSGLHLPDLTHWPVGRDGVGGDLRASISHFLDCIETGAAPVMPVSDAHRTETVVHALRESIRTQAPVVLS